jgi:hypothetical protein
VSDARVFFSGFSPQKFSIACDHQKKNAFCRWTNDDALCRRCSSPNVLSVRVVFFFPREEDRKRSSSSSSVVVERRRFFHREEQKQQECKDGYEIGIRTLRDEEEDTEKKRRGRNNNTARGDR